MKEKIVISVPIKKNKKNVCLYLSYNVCKRLGVQTNRTKIYLSLMGGCFFLTKNRPKIFLPPMDLNKDFFINQR